MDMEKFRYWVTRIFGVPHIPLKSDRGWFTESRAPVRSIFKPAPETLPADPVGNLSDQLQRKRARLVADLERAQRIELTAREQTRAFRTCIRACDHALSVIEAHHATADQFRKIQDYRS